MTVSKYDFKRFAEVVKRNAMDLSPREEMNIMRVLESIEESLFDEGSFH